MKLGSIITLALIFQLEASRSPAEYCDIGYFKVDEQTSVEKCLDGLFVTCTDRSKDPKNCNQLTVNNRTNLTTSPAQNCTPQLGDEDRCGAFMINIQKNRLAYYFLAERYDDKISYYKPIKDFMSSILNELPPFVDDENFSETISLFCRNLNFTTKACQNLLSFCKSNSEDPLCRHSSFSAVKDYMECFKNPKYLDADCEDICNVTQTKKYFGFDGINQSRCDALSVRCQNVSSAQLLLRCEKRLKLAEICLVENNETYAPCEAAVQSMSATYDALDYTLRKHRCYSPLICFQYLKQVVLQMKMSLFMHDHCQLQGPPEYFGEICHIMGEFCYNTDLKVGDDGKSSCGDWMKYPKEKVDEIVQTTPQFNGWTLIFVLGQIVVMAGGAWAGARPYLDNVQIKLEKLKGEQKKRAEEIQKKRNHFTERDLCVNFHRLVFIQDALYFGFIVYESFCTNDCTYSMFFIGMWAAIFTRTYKTAKLLNKGLKANWEKALWTHGRKEYATADNTCILLSWLLSILVWRKYARFEKLFDYRFWPVFVSLFMAFGFTAVKITIRWLLPLSVDRIVVEKPRIPPKERRRVIHNIKMFMALPYNETDKAVLRKRKIAQKKGEELAIEDKPKRRVKALKKPPMAKKSKESKDSTGSKSSTFWQWMTRHNTTTVVNEQNEHKSASAQIKKATKSKKHKKNGKKGKAAKTGKAAHANLNAPQLKNGQEVQKKDKKVATDSPAIAPAKTENPQKAPAKGKAPAKERKTPAKEKKTNSPTKKLDQGNPPSKDKPSAAKIKENTKTQQALPQLPKGAKNVKKKK